MSVLTAAGSRMSAVTQGIAFAALAAASLSTAGFIAKQLVDDGTPGVVVAFYEVAFGLLFLTAARARSLRSGLRLERGVLRWIVIAGICFALATASFYTALASIDFSVGAPIIGVVPLVSYAFVLIVLRGHERLTVRSVLGATLVVGGVALIGAAN